MRPAARQSLSGGNPASLPLSSRSQTIDSTASPITTSWYRLAVAVLCVVYLYRCLHFNFVADDAFISFRYARNVADGLGFVFNPGERVEGYTNFLIVIVLAAFRRAGADIVLTGRALSVAAGVGMVAATAAVARRMRASTASALSASLLVAVNPFVAVWGGSGLETTTFGFLLLLVILPLAGGTLTRGRFVWCSVWALLLALTRPEGAIVYPVVVGMAILELARTHVSVRERWMTLAPGFVGYVVIGGAYFVWRWRYFGALLPNTFTAKTAFSLYPLWFGSAYVVGFLINPCVLFVFLLVIEGASGRLRPRAPVVVLAVLTSVVVLEGGDGLPMYRFLVPLYPLFAIVGVLGLERFVSRTATGRSSRQVIAAGIVAAVFVLSFFPRDDSQYELFVYQRDYEIPRWRAAGIALKQALPPDALVAAAPIGALGWYSNLRVLDILGLTDPVIARQAADPTIRWTGHRKHDGAYVVSRRPTAILLGNVFVDADPEWPSVPPSELNPRFAASEGDIVANPEFTSLYRAATLQIGPDWYLHYYLRRDAGTP